MDQNQNNVKQAKIAYETLLQMLDEDGWRYEKDEEKLTISCKARGEDIPIDVRMEVEPQRQLIFFLSILPFPVPENRRAEMAVAVTRANFGIVDGSFDYDFVNGMIIFRLTASFRESLISKELLKYMIYVSCGTVDDYNDKLMMVAKSEMGIQEIMEFIQ